MLLLPQHSIALLSLALGTFSAVFDDKIIVSGPQRPLNTGASREEALKSCQRLQVNLGRIVVVVSAAHSVGICKRNAGGG
jgi:hypothetical protein